jgi:hypothetical protein
MRQLPQVCLPSRPISAPTPIPTRPVFHIWPGICSERKSIATSNQLQIQAEYRPNHYKRAVSHDQCVLPPGILFLYPSHARAQVNFRVLECTCTRAQESLDSRCVHGPGVLGAEGLGCIFQTIALSVHQGGWRCCQGDRVLYDGLTVSEISTRCVKCRPSRALYLPQCNGCRSLSLCTSH